MSASKRFAIWSAVVLLCTGTPTSAAMAQQSPGRQVQQAGSETNSIFRKIGVVTAVGAKEITLNSDAGETVNIRIQDGARMVRIAPGEKNLKNATPIQFADIHPGDRVLVAGRLGSDASLLGASVILIRRTDVAQKQARETEEWEKDGVGGIVKSVDAANGTITIALTPAYGVVVKTTNSTEFLRYAGDSVRFSDAKPSSLAEVAIGEQLRAEGARSADGEGLIAKRVICGMFRNIAGTVEKIEAADSTLVVKDVLAHKKVVIRITPDSRMRKLPHLMALRVAALLKAAPQAHQSATAKQPPDLQQILAKAPPIALQDLQQDSAVIIVATPGDGTKGITAVTLLSGVEPILMSAPSGVAAQALLSGWNLSTTLAEPGVSH